MILRVSYNELTTPDHQGEVRINCPFCTSRVGKVDRKRHLYINIYKKLFNCFRCQASGIVQFTDPAPPLPTPPRSNTQVESLPEEMIPLPEAVKIYPSVSTYVKSRSLPLYPYWGYVPSYTNSKYAACIIIPIFFNDIYQGFAARRTFITWKSKWCFSQGLKTKQILYNYDRVQGDTCYVVEGIFDTLTLPELSVATFGCSLSLRQMELLSMKYKKVVMLYDGEAYENSLKYGRCLLEYMDNVFVVRLEKYKDPFDYTPQELLSLKEINILEALLLNY